MVMRVLLLLLVVTPSILAAPASLCPAMCKCTNTGINVEARCSSLNFAKKTLLHEQLKLLTTLDVNNASLTKLNVNLKIFPNLKRLNLSSNSIKQISSNFLPNSLELIDLSHNFIKYLPHHLHLLPNLKEVHLEENPLYCDCDSVSVIEELLKYDVVVHLPQCAHPKQHKGKMWKSVQCKETLFEGMQGDAPYEGSGFDDTKNQEEIEREFIRPELEHEVTTEADVEEEGSGDESQEISPTTEDYDDATHNVIEPLIVPVDKSDLHSVYVRPCNFDCSTPAPLDNSNETGELPAPNLFDGLRIIANDLGIMDDTKNDTQSSTSSVELTSEVSTKITLAAEIMDSGLKNNEELSNITASSEKQSNTSYIFLGLFLAAIVCLLLYVMLKKRAAARRNMEISQTDESKTDQLEEVELLTKPNPDAGKTNGTPESVPLINGNKDNKKNEDDGLSKTIIKEPEVKNEEIELRKPADNNLLTPEAKRVTIKAGEIPNSTPKTPVLVTRHLSSDGSIVTTPNIDQRV